MYISQCLKYDVSLQPQDYYDCVVATREIIQNASTLSQEEKDSIVTVGYGHVGDGNLHLNCSLQGYDDEGVQERLNDLIDPFVMAYVRDKKGSVSAEHGVGL